MIKVGIIGCDNLRAAELVRVLINHPDVELMWASGDVAVGTRLEHVVPGIVGECDLSVNVGVTMENVDLVYLCGSRRKVAACLKTLDTSHGVKVIDMSGCHNMDCGPEQPWKYGLSEMQRRLLVHDTSLVTLPGGAAAAAMLAIMPLARNLLLNSPLTLRVAMGALAFPDEGKTIDGLTPAELSREQGQEVRLALSLCQSSFDQPVELTISPLAERRTLAVAARCKCGVDGSMIRQLYEQYYEDHNFIFMVDRPIVSADVENTNKCLIRLEKDEQSGELTVHAVMDLLLKGSAGMAVHMMNLLFGLHERAGLVLKGTGC